VSILIDRGTRVLVQGITGVEGRFHTSRMLEDGTNVVAGVTPGKAGQSVEGVPVYDTVIDAVAETGADASILFVPAASAADAVLEAADAGIALVVCLTEGIPVHDILPVLRYVDLVGAKLIGPNTPGLISPGKSKLGVMAGYIHRQGTVGVLSRSGTLTYEVVHQLTALGVGQSTCVGIGGDPVVGLSYADLLPMFEADPGTEGIILIGEIGGSAEQEAAELIRAGISKPVVAYIAGRNAPPERRMGHAGAVVGGRSGTAEAKMKALAAAGATVVTSPAEIGAAMAKLVTGKRTPRKRAR
jgi:succinyl-CoA synthetase alpha subunit